MEQFLHGASYYPLMEDGIDVWHQDLKTMKDLGINYVRTAEIFNGWDQLEIRPGEFRFAELEKFFDVCEQYDIKILLGSGSASPPYWLHQMDENVNILSSNGKRYPVNTSYGWACYNNPTFIERHASYLENLIKYFKNHKSLLAYQINNEIGYPFVPLGNGDIEVYCYCDHCKSEYRKWVKNKYKTLQNLNHAWRWSATNVYHTDWEQVEPPYAKPTAWASVTRWLDWRLFQMDVITNQVRRENKIIKSLDTEHFTTVNIFYMQEYDALNVMTCIDQFELAKEVDIIGYDVYPSSHNKLETRPEYASMALDHARSVSKPLNKNYLLAETEAGPIGGWILGPEYTTTYQDMIRYQMEAIGHDAKTVMYQLFKEYEFQPLHFGGTIGLEGEKTQRTDAVRVVSDFAEENAEFINNSNTKRGKIALLVSKENHIVFNGVGQEKFLVKELRGVYSAIHDLGYEIDFITLEHFRNGYVKNYEVVYAPLLAVVQKELSEQIADYVSEGGTFIAGARFSFMEEHGWYSRHMPSYELPDMFGMKVVEVYCEQSPTITYKQSAYLGIHHKEDIEVTCGEVLGTFDDGKPAIVKNSFGKGKAIYIGSHIGNAYFEEGLCLIKDIFENEVDCLPDIVVDYDGKEAREIDVHSLSYEDKEMLIITNSVKKAMRESFFNDKKKTITISHADINISSVYDNSEDEAVDFKSGNRIVFDTVITEGQTKIITLKK